MVGGGVEDAVVGWGRDKRRGSGARVLALQNREDGVDVQRGEGPLWGEGRGFVAYVEGVVEEPDISFGADAAK